MKKTNSPIYFRYEFSDETGTPEGGDIFKLSTMEEVQEMAEDILKVANSDNVTVNLTIGEEAPFFGFLKSVGMNREDAEKELVNLEIAARPSAKKTSKKKSPAKAKTKAKSGKTKVKKK